MAPLHSHQYLQQSNHEELAETTRQKATASPYYPYTKLTGARLSHLACFERLGRQLPEARVQAPSIVIDFDILEHLRFGHLSRDEAFAVNGLDFEAVVPALHCRDSRLSCSCCTAGGYPVAGADGRLNSTDRPGR